MSNPLHWLRCATLGKVTSLFRFALGLLLLHRLLLHGLLLHARGCDGRPAALSCSHLPMVETGKQALEFRLVLRVGELQPLLGTNEERLFGLRIGRNSRKMHASCRGMATGLPIDFRHLVLAIPGTISRQTAS